MMRKMKMPGGMMVTGTPLTPTRPTRPGRLPPMWRLTCGSVTARLARVGFKWMRWTSRRLRSITGIGGND